MVFKFRLLSDEKKKFIRDIELLSDQTFFDFHKALTKNLHYDRTQIASFYISNQNWEKLTEITLFDMTEENSRKELHIMDKTRLDEYINSAKQRLLYVFDFFNERLFFVELVSISEKKAGEYPKISFSEGSPPQQLLMDNINFEDLNSEE